MDRRTYRYGFQLLLALLTAVVLTGSGCVSGLATIK